MTDYWKSNPRKYCEACKCWFGDNKISVDFHEGGRRHQENVKKQLSEARRKHVETEKEQQKTARALAAIEQAAIQAYQKDLVTEYEGGPVQEASRAKIAQQVNPELQQFSQLSQPVGGVQDTQEQDEIKQKIQENIEKKLKELKKQKKVKQDSKQLESQVWQQFTSPEGYTYYYNTQTGVSQWEVPAGFQPQQEESSTSQQRQQHQEPSSNKSKEKPSSSSFSDSGTKRGAEQASVESSEHYQPPKRSAGPYGAWSTVSVTPKPEIPDEKLDQQSPSKNEQENGDDLSSDEDGSQDDDVMQIREKTMPGLDSEGHQSGNKPSFKSFGFKKRAGNRPQIRQRTDNI